MSKLIIANWKSHKKTSQVAPWVQTVGTVPQAVRVAVAAPFTLLSLIKDNLPATIQLAAQTVSPFPLGAYTGAIAAEQLADLGVVYCLAGHSERRRYFHETDQDVLEQASRLTEQRIKPIICIDEPYLDSQLSLLKSAGIDGVVAYEPLSAIGTGANASVGTVKNIVDKVRAYGFTQVIYGGSVSPEIVGDYMLVCDGALVGGASLDGGEFSRLLAVAAGTAPEFS